MKENIAKEKSMQFSIRVVKLYNYLCETKKECIMSKQLLRCGTSIGANLAEAECAISNKDFLAKIYIALKECSETRYWLELLNKTEYLTDSEYESMSRDCSEILKILMATTKTMAEKT